MKKKMIFLIPIVVMFLYISIASAQEDYDLTWWTVDGGGGDSSGGSYTLSGTIGQADAGTHTGDSYTLIGGFWNGQRRGVIVIPPGGREIYLPLITKG